MEHQIIINGLKINYDESGNPSGAPVIILHGWGCNLSTVKSIGVALEDGMRVLSVDLPGHGKSDEPQQIWGTQDFAGLIGNFIEHLKLKNPALIGHSFGGRTSIAYAAKNDINKLVLIDSAGIVPKRTLRYYYKIYSFKALKKIAFACLGKEKGGKIVEKIIKKKGSSDYLSSSPQMRAIMSKCINEDLRHQMPSIKSPTLLIWGENDTATPVSDAKIMERQIPDVGLVNFPNCGHYSFLDNPLGFKAVIRSFFSRELSPAS